MIEFDRTYVSGEHRVEQRVRQDVNTSELANEAGPDVDRVRIERRGQTVFAEKIVKDLDNECDSAVALADDLCTEQACCTAFVGLAETSRAPTAYLTGECLCIDSIGNSIR